MKANARIVKLVNSPRARAIHEAGHAAVAAHLGHAVELVTIEEGNPRCVTPSPGPRSLTAAEAQAYVEARICIALAGAEAVAQETSVEWLPPSDAAAIQAVLSAIQPAAARAPIRDAMEKRTQQLVQLLWPRIERIAAALLEKTTLYELPD